MATTPSDPVGPPQVGTGPVLTERDQQLLMLIARFRLLSRNQVMALAPFGSLTRANTRLARLVRARLLSRKLQPVYPGRGSAQTLYFLGPASSNVLPLDRSLVERQIRQVRRWDLRQIAHVQATNDVILAWRQAVKQRPEASELGFLTETELRDLFQHDVLVPDGWVAWVQDKRRFNCFVEVDLHHEGLGQWRAKIGNYQRYAESGHHQELFGCEAFRVLVLANSRRRLHRIRTLAVVAGAMFLFAELASIRADTILGPMWQRAYGPDRIPLIQA